MPSARLPFLAVAWAVGCASSTEPKQVETGAPVLPSTVTTPLPTRRAAPDPSDVAASLPSGAANPPCQSDSSCGWDDSCFPSRCLLGASPAQACDESGPPPGACRCLAGQCAVVYKGSQGRCDTDAECTWDDPCVPRSCGKGTAKPASCDKSAAPPGQCRCVAHVCAGVSDGRR